LTRPLSVELEVVVVASEAAVEAAAAGKLDIESS